MVLSCGPMKHSGKAGRAGRRLIFGAWIALVLLFVVGFLGTVVGPFVMGLSIALFGLWMVFAVFTLCFFRDPEARVPQGSGLVLSPGHGKVDVIDETEEPRFIGGRCKRVSIFLSIFNVHV